MSVDITRAEDALQHLIAEAAKVEPLRAENRHLREIIARMPKPRTIYSRRVDATIAACPFCGGTSTVYESGLRDGCLDGEPDAWTSAVTCCSCAAVGPWRKADTRADAEQRALAAWSTRPTSNANLALAGALRAAYTAMSESPIPQAPPDCDLAGWIRYAVRCWRSEREGVNHLADLCQAAHDVLTAVGAPPDGTPAKRIETLYSALSAQLHEANDARTRLVDNADWVIQALARANKLRAKDTWHQDAAGVIREFSAVLSKLMEAEAEIDDCCRILHVSGDRDLRAVVTDLMRELEERRCASIRAGWTADSEKSTQGEHPATMGEKP